MAKSAKAPPGKGEGPPHPEDYKAFSNWLAKQPRPWSTTIAARAALRVLPFMRGTRDLPEIVLPVFRAIAIVRFAAKYQDRATDTASRAAHAAATDAAARATDAAYAVARAADAA